MKNVNYIALVLLLLFTSCSKSEFSWDASYPTTINKLDDQTLEKLKAEFYENNTFITSSLNQFGFCDWQETQRNSVSPPLLAVLTQTEAIGKAKEFIENNKIFLGVTGSASVDFGRVDLSTGQYWDGASYWMLNSNAQKVDSIEVLYTQIFIRIKNQEVVHCAGNWYPSVYIPNKFNVGQAEARRILLNRIVHHSTFAGVDYTVKISPDALDASKINLKIYPVETDDKIQLHVTWAINIPGPVFYLIFVDVMTGEIIAEQPTIIS